MACLWAAGLSTTLSEWEDALDDDLDFAMARVDLAVGRARERLNYLVGLADRYSGKMEKEEFIAGIRGVLGE
ncbi:MAG: hypothetical protein M0001_06100 [Treponema sp.]|nr:hypothetical protein [Treponema sp.]